MKKTVAYITSRFPKISETFVLYEIVELRRLGLEVEIFPLIHHKEGITHTAVESLIKHVHYNRVISWDTLATQLYWFFRRPKTYVEIWLQVISKNIKSLKLLPRSIIVILLAGRFARQMADLGVEHIHAHWATHPTLTAYIIKKLTGLSYSFTAHANDIYVQQIMLREKIEEAAFVVTISEYNKQFLHRLYGEVVDKRVVIIHCGIDSKVFEPRSEQIQVDTFTIICVARLDEKKGHKYLIQACATLKAKNIDFQCLIVGEGENRPELEAQISQLQLRDSVKLLGLQPRHKVYELLSNSHAMILPSIITEKGEMEGIPVALMEALAMRLPVVATAISGVPELIEDHKTGLLVPQRDSEAIAEALMILHDSPELGQQMGISGRDKVLKEFDLYRNTETLYHIMQQQ